VVAIRDSLQAAVESDHMSTLRQPNSQDPFSYSRADCSHVLANQARQERPVCLVPTSGRRSRPTTARPHPHRPRPVKAAVEGAIEKEHKTHAFNKVSVALA
jgi:hypothetical protein